MKDWESEKVSEGENVCMCVREKERMRETEREKERERERVSEWVSMWVCEWKTKKKSEKEQEKKNADFWSKQIETECIQGAESWSKKNGKKMF